MIILNFSHPLTKEQIAAICETNGWPDASLKIVDVSSQIDPARPIAPQAAAMVDAAGLSDAEWQGQTVFAVLPSLNYSAVCVLVELRWRAGYYPPMIRLRQVAGSLPPKYEVAEIVRLELEQKGISR